MERKRCRACTKMLPIKEFKSKVTGKTLLTCRKCQKREKIHKVLIKNGCNDILMKVFINSKPSIRKLKKEMYCMRCGKPFFHTMKGLKTERTKIIPREISIEFGYYESKNGNDFIFCLECLRDRLNDVKFNLFKYRDKKDRIGTLIKRDVCIDDLTKKEYKYVYSDYPFNKKIKETKNIHEHIKSINLALQKEN